MNVPAEFEGSPALQLVINQDWEWKQLDSKQIELEKCPYCGKGGYGHFYMDIQGDISALRNRDGLYICHRCGKSGNLYQLKKDMGLSTPEPVRQQREVKAPDELPDVEKCHEELMQDEDALDYLMNERGFSRAIIIQQRLGLKQHYFRETGNHRAIVYPYLVNGNCVWAHYRTLPTMPAKDSRVPKAFSCPAGYDAILYNGDILNSVSLPTNSITLVEGEANVIAALDKGIEDIVGVPGANIKKAEWINTLDKMELERIYICYDKDTAGQKAAQVIASRIGVERCWKIVLPEFHVESDGGLRPGKDLNEWFAVGGGTRERWEELQRGARLFDVDGVASAQNAVHDLYDELVGKGTIEPAYKSPWASLNRWIGFDAGDVIDILAPEKVGKTTFGMNLMEHMVDTYREDGVIICLEMTSAKIARKYMAMKANIADNIPRDGEEAKKLLAEFLEAIPKVREGIASREADLYFCYPRYKTVEDIYSLIRDCIRRYGAKWIMLDNLQRLSDTTIGSKNRTNHLSEISKVTSQIAKDFNVQMVRILQPHRIPYGQMVTTDSVDGSSQVAKDCDCMITLHRDKVTGGSLQEFQSVGFVEGEGSFDSKMKVTVGLSRYSQGGYTTLEYDGARSQVREYNMGQLAQFQENANKAVGYEKQIAIMQGGRTAGISV